MKKFLFFVMMAVSAVLMTSAQNRVKDVTIYGERPNADSFRDPDAVKSVLAYQYGAFESDETITVSTSGAPVEYWYRHDAKQTFLVIRTGKKQEITFWFQDASDKMPEIDWKSAVVTNKNGIKIKLVFAVKTE